MQMVIFIKVIFLMVCQMVVEKWFFQMETLVKVFGKIII